MAILTALQSLRYCHSSLEFLQHSSMSLLTNAKQLVMIKKHRGFTATSSAMKNKDW